MNHCEIYVDSSLDLQLPVQSVPVTTKVSLNPVHSEVYPIQHYDKVCQ
jgi:hypothetical protein